MIVFKEKLTSANYTDKLSIIHSQENGMTPVTDVTSTINIPIRLLYGGDYDVADIIISSSDNVVILSEPHIINDNEVESYSLDYDFNITVDIVSDRDKNPLTITDVGFINISCSIIKDSATVINTSLLLNVLISPEVVIISEFGIDTIELCYYEWLKSESLISDQEYDDFLILYHGVDFIIENGNVDNDLRPTVTNRFSEEINNQRFQLNDEPQIGTLAVYQETASTTTATASSVYVQYSVTLQNSGETLYVSGTVFWKDTNGVEHPLKNSYVEIIDEDIAFDDYQARVYTDSAGFFSATFANQTGWDENGCDIFFRIYSRNTNVIVQNLNDENRKGYYFQTNTDNNINTEITDKIQGIEDTDVAKSFSVMQALNEGINYVTAIDSSETYLASSVFPSPSIVGTCYSLKNLFILKDDYCDWDIILHEFGHYIADTIDIDDSPGGDHSSSDDLLDTSSNKSKAIRLAWSEGWATYLSIAAQRYLSLSGIPNVGDYNYTDTIDSNLNYSIRTPQTIGEANERDISYMLIMLNDYFDSFSGVDGYKYIWNVAKGSGSETFSDFYNALISKP